MAYSDFTMPQVQERFGLSINDYADLFGEVAPVEPPAGLADLLARFVPLASTGNEKLRSELVVAPVLAEFKIRHKDRVSLFSGIDFVVDKEVGLAGRCDFLLARSPRQLVLEAPVCVVAEAKNDDLLSGVPQCLAGMVAAQRFNAAAGHSGPVFGAATTGELWRFLRLDGTVARVDATSYPIQDLPKLFGILSAIAL